MQHDISSQSDAASPFYGTLVGDRPGVEVEVKIVCSVDMSPYLGNDGLDLEQVDPCRHISF
jgi:hypothetical protein